MKILLLIISILFFIVPLKSYSTTKTVEILENKGFHIINPPSDSNIFWNRSKNQKWLAFYTESFANMKLFIPNNKINPSSFKGLKHSIKHFITHGTSEVALSTLKEETVTNCHLHYGDILRILGFSTDDSMVIVEAHQHKYNTLSSYGCEEMDIFALPKEALGKPSEMGVDIFDVGQIAYYNKDFQRVDILSSWMDRVEWVNDVRKYFDIQPTRRNTCNIRYGEPVKILDYFGNESLVFVESISSKSGTACGEGDQFDLPIESIGKLIHYF